MFLFETKLIPILEASIKEQHDILIEASVQRSKLELDGATSNTEPNRPVKIEKFLKNLEMSRCCSYILRTLFV